MIWLIGNKGMLGNDVEKLLREAYENYVKSVCICKLYEVNNKDEINEDLSVLSAKLGKLRKKHRNVTNEL